MKSVRFAWRWSIQQPAAERELLGAMAVGEEAVMTDAMEAVRHGVEQEAPNELSALRAMIFDLP